MARKHFQTQRNKYTPKSNLTPKRGVRNLSVAEIKSTKSFETISDKDIQKYGDDNNYPLKIKQIANASISGRNGINTLTKFITGQGIEDAILRDMVINSKGQTLNDLIKALKKDYARWCGFYIHVNYNALGEIISMDHIPFEHLRLGAPDKETREVNTVKVHPNWTGEFNHIKKHDKKDIISYSFFEPNIDVILQQVEQAGIDAKEDSDNEDTNINPWDYYTGQVLFYSDEGDKLYPIPFYEPALTDMSSETGVSDVINRNVNNNFFPAGLIVEKVPADQSEGEKTATEKIFKALQGSKNAVKLAYMATDDIEAIKFLPFRGNNYDKEFDQTQKVVPQNIGRSFTIPPILRGEIVATGFSTTAMQEAYEFYNVFTSDMRTTVDDKINEVLKYWFTPITTKIVTIPLIYGIKEPANNEQ